MSRRTSILGMFRLKAMNVSGGGLRDVFRCIEDELTKAVRALVAVFNISGPTNSRGRREATIAV